MNICECIVSVFAIITTGITLVLIFAPTENITVNREDKNGGKKDGGKN